MSSLRRKSPLLPSRANRGMALVIAMWITLGLAFIAVVFGNSMMLEYRASENQSGIAQAEQAVQSGARYAAFIIKNSDEPGILPDEENYENEACPVGDGAFWMIGRDEEESGDSLVFGLVSESSKLNLNTATREMLEALPGMTAEIAAAIVDWRDSDEELTDGGAEAQEYLLQDIPYECKNAPFETVRELRLVMGVDLELLYGEDANLNGVLDSNEDDGLASSPEDNQDGVLDPGVLEYVTVYSREPNQDSEGNQRINLTSNESTQALREALEGSLGSDRVSQIMQRTGNRQQIGSVLEFYLEGGMTLDECLQVEGKLTTSDDNYLTGLVNINEASRAVLAALPGIGEDNADAVMAWRAGKDSSELASVRWLGEVLEASDAERAGPWVTVYTYQVTADVAGTGKTGRGFQRAAMVLDSSAMNGGGGEEECRLLFREDRSNLGWPLGGNIREELKAEGGFEG